jgi:enamine deaminase RidA (YjgF/YER057c/UK114 family)
MSITNKLKEKNIELPEAKPPVANYASFTKAGNLIFISGQVSNTLGKVGKNLSLEQGYAAARECAISVLSQLKLACDGNLDKVKSCVRLGVFVNCTDDYIDQPKVANGASDLIAEIIGKHARAAVGTNALPRGVAVEVEAIFEI